MRFKTTDYYRNPITIEIVDIIIKDNNPIYFGVNADYLKEKEYQIISILCARDHLGKTAISDFLIVIKHNKFFAIKHRYHYNDIEVFPEIYTLPKKSETEIQIEKLENELKNLKETYLKENQK